jgi:hypothetical protein
VPRTSGEIVPNNQLRFLAEGTSGGRAMTGGGLTLHQEFVVEDHRPAGSPPIETSTSTGADGRQIMKAVVRGGLTELERSGELGAFLARGLRRAPAAAVNGRDRECLVALTLELLGEELGKLCRLCCPERTNATAVITKEQPPLAD